MAAAWAAKTGLYAVPVAGRVVGRRINEQGHRDDYNEEIERIQRFEVNEDPNKTNCLSTVEKDNMIAVAVRVGAMPNKDGELGTSQSRRIYSTDGKSVSLQARPNGGGPTVRPPDFMRCPPVWRGGGVKMVPPLKCGTTRKATPWPLPGTRASWL